MKTQIIVCKENLNSDRFVKPFGNQGNNKPYGGGLWTSTEIANGKSGWLEITDSELSLQLIIGGINILNESELRNARKSLAENIFNNGFTIEMTTRTVSKLTESGFNIEGAMGATYRKDEGLTLWSKEESCVGKKFKLNELINLEKELAHEPNKIWLGWIN